MFDRLLQTTRNNSFFLFGARGLARFTGDFANAAALCVSRDRTRMRMDGVLCLHWRDAIAELGLT